MVLSYLVSTAGHAQAQNEDSPHDIRTILQLITEGAEEFGDEKVVGFTSPGTAQSSGESSWICDRYSFRQILEMSDSMAAVLVDLGIEANRDAARMMSILFPTGLDFLIIWITLMRMGYGVVLVAPQCSPAAIRNLHTTTSSVATIYHSKYSSLAEETGRLDPSIQLVEWVPGKSGSTPTNHGIPALKDIHINPDSTSHVFHSSGTSGLPKPIPNTHARSVDVLPRRALPSYLSTTEGDSQCPDRLAPPSESAAFTTTPLFHGGVSDLLRAWMARSLIYFYPTSDVPITVKNIVAAVKACRAPPPDLPRLLQLSQEAAAERCRRFRPTAFLSVPYILSTLAEDLDGEGTNMLQGMEFVSTGGAPLDTLIGDAMVQRGIRLVSRLGSSECGFLLSSHRDYETEKDWELLRNDSPYADALRFEETDAGPSGTRRYEMVVTSNWTSLTKSNREDGSYASGDLYEKHPTKEAVWRYVGRGDDVIVMSNGEKASPGPVESVLRTSAELADALVVGSERPQLGLLLFPRRDSSLRSLLPAITPLIDQANQTSPSFAHISTDMCLVIGTERAARLPKSSKGTIQRGVANEVYKEEIDRLYSGAVEEARFKNLPRRDPADIRKFILETVVSVAGEGSHKTPVGLNTDLFNWGVNSVMATRIRTVMSKSLHTGGRALPQNIVFEQPTIQRLADYVYQRQEGIEENHDPDNDPLRLMETLASRYGAFNPTIPAASCESSCSATLLTGATGSLGVHLLHRLCSESSGNNGKIICLVRADDDNSARTRIISTLSSRNLQVDQSRLVALAADVTKEKLGLADSVYKGLVKTVEIVIHAAWPVHFASSLVSFEDQIKGTRNLIDLVRNSPSGTARFHFCSSIASVLGGSASAQDVITETPSSDPATASPIGYSQSKWVVERICEMANQVTDMSGRVHVMRIGQLCGDTAVGYWNEKEGWPLLIRTVQTTGTLPDLTDEPSWLPVDLAAQTIIDIIRQPGNELVYHVVHPTRISWNTVLAGLREAGIAFETTSREGWLEKVQSSISAKEEDPSSGMLPLWTSAYGRNAQPIKEPRVSCDNARGASSTLQHIQPLQPGDIGRTVQSWRSTGFL